VKNSLSKVKVDEKIERERWMLGDLQYGHAVGMYFLEKALYGSKEFAGGGFCSFSLC